MKAMSKPVDVTYRPDIDGLRAIAVLSVILYHLNRAWLPGGFLGVDIFFVISGFVVTSSLIAKPPLSLATFLSEFYSRRLARIIPGLVVMLAVTTVLSTLFIPDAWLSRANDSVRRFAFWGLSNWKLQNLSHRYFDPTNDFNPFTHTWSLGIEEQFYVVAPLIVFLWVVARRQNKSATRAVLGGFAVLALGSLCASIWYAKKQPDVAFYSLGSRFWELSTGVLLCLAKDSERFSRWKKFLFHSDLSSRRLVSGVATLGLVLLGASVWLAEAKSGPWPWILLPVSGTVLLVVAGESPTDFWVKKLLASSTLVWLGKRSYSLYLWHWPILVLWQWTVGLKGVGPLLSSLFTFTSLALLSYKFVETPMRYGTWIGRHQAWRRNLGFLLLIGLGLGATELIREYRSSLSFSVVMKFPSDWYPMGVMPFPEAGERRCQVTMATNSFLSGVEARYRPAQCPESLGTKKVFLLGDSSVYAFNLLLDQLAGEFGIEGFSYYKPSCGFIDFAKPMADPSRTADCREFTQEISAMTLRNAQPGDVVVLPSFRIDHFLNPKGEVQFKDLWRALYSPRYEVGRADAVVDARNWLRGAAAKGIKVLFVAPTPVMRSQLYRCADWFNRNNPICQGGHQVDREELERIRRPVLESMKALSAEFNGVEIWDPFQTLCPDNPCTNTREGRPLFIDDYHLSAYAALVLYPEFKEIMMKWVGPGDSTH